MDKSKIDSFENKIDSIENKIDLILNILENDVIKKCDKMSRHIDFIDTVYNNVKNPLGYICNKINYLRGNNNYSLESN